MIAGLPCYTEHRRCLYISETQSCMSAVVPFKFRACCRSYLLPETCHRILFIRPILLIFHVRAADCWVHEHSKAKTSWGCNECASRAGSCFWRRRIFESPRLPRATPALLSLPFGHVLLVRERHTRQVSKTYGPFQKKPSLADAQ